MAHGTRGRAAPRWTRDDILREAAETFSLLPRPTEAARRAFTALLREFWPQASGGTRTTVAGVLRASPRVAADVLDTLDILEAPTWGGDALPAGTHRDIAAPAMEPDAEPTVSSTLIARAVRVSHRPGLRVTATVCARTRAPLPVEEEPFADATDGRERIVPPPLAHDPHGAPEGAIARDADAPAHGSGGTAADHARSVLAHLALTGSQAAPALQPGEVEAALGARGRPGAALSRLLDLSPARAEAIVAVPRARGVAVALRALGLAPDAAAALVARWRGRVPTGFAEAYAALPLAECLDTVAAWRRQDEALRDAANGERAADETRRSA